MINSKDFQKKRLKKQALKSSFSYIFVNNTVTTYDNNDVSMKSIIISIQQTKDLSYMHSLLLHIKANQVSFISIRFVYRGIQSVAISNTCFVYYFPNFLYYFPVYLLTSFLLLFAYNKNKIFMGSYFLGGFQ